MSGLAKTQTPPCYLVNKDPICVENQVGTHTHMHTRTMLNKSVIIPLIDYALNSVCELLIIHDRGIEQALPT